MRTLHCLHPQQFPTSSARKSIFTFSCGRVIIMTPSGYNLMEVPGCRFCKYIMDIFHQQRLTHWARDKMADISQTTVSNANFRMKIYQFRLIFHLKFVPKSQINNISVLVQIMVWCRPGLDSWLGSVITYHRFEDVITYPCPNLNVGLAYSVSERDPRTQPLLRDHSQYIIIRVTLPI